MKGWGVFLAVGIVLLVVFSAAGGDRAAAAEVRLDSFHLGSSSGYAVRVVAARVGRGSWAAEVDAASGRLGASYQVPAGRSSRIRATFGTLGQLDVRFRRRSEKIRQLEPGCRWIIERGVFVGSFRFVGEGGYFSREAVDPAGEALRMPNGFCGLGGNRLARPPELGLRKTELAAWTGGTERETSFQASHFDTLKLASFDASLRERVGQMKILRTARAAGGPRNFTSKGTTRASVSPPPPFSGSATFHDGAAGAAWTGSLSVSFPGAPETALAGEGFLANLCPRLSLLSSCGPPHAGAASPRPSGTSGQRLPLPALR